MTDVAIYEPQLPALPERVGVPGTQDFDSWVGVVVQVVKLADTICDTPFVPDGLRGSSPAVAAAILAGREMGLGPMTSLANIDVIRGKPAPKPVLMRALVLSRGHKWVEVDVSDVRVVLRGCRKGESDWAEVTFTAQQAKTAGIDLGKYPVDKLYARASSRLAKRKFADVIMGMPYSADEIEDGEDENGAIALAPAAPAAAIEAPAAKPATAQRRTRKAEPADRPTSVPSANGSEGATQDRQPPALAKTARSDQRSTPTTQAEGLPPLPGEEDPDPSSAATAATSDASTARTGTDEPNEADYDTPGTATVGKGGQLSALWTVLQNEFGFTTKDKDHARGVCEQIIRRDLGDTTGNLSRNEARMCLDTLANWKATAEARGESPRDVMIAELAAGDADAAGA